MQIFRKFLILGGTIGKRNMMWTGYNRDIKDFQEISQNWSCKIKKLNHYKNMNFLRGFGQKYNNI